jgi:hypothetical protein
LVGKLKGKRKLGKSKLRCQENIKIDIKEIRCENTDQIPVA